MTWPLYPSSLPTAGGPGLCGLYLVQDVDHLLPALAISPSPSHLSSTKHPGLALSRVEGGSEPPLPPSPSPSSWSWGGAAGTPGETELGGRERDCMEARGSAWGPVGAPHSLGTLLQETSCSSKNSYNQSCASICNNLPRTSDESFPPINHWARG